MKFLSEELIKIVFKFPRNILIPQICEIFLPGVTQKFLKILSKHSLIPQIYEDFVPVVTQNVLEVSWKCSLIPQI